MTPEEQSNLFIKTARDLGVDETGQEFERAFAKVAQPKRPVEPSTRGKSGPPKRA